MKKYIFITALLLFMASCKDSKENVSITFNQVKTDPSKFIGEQVTWIGASFASTITPKAITKFWRVNEGDDDAVFATIQEDEKRTEAAKVRDTIRYDFIRKVTGTISRDQVEYRSGSRVIKVPLLKKVVVDAPDATSKQ